MLKIYITDLAAYNNGFLIGKWITLPTEDKEIKEEIKQILQEGSKACGENQIHEEFFISDYEWDLGIKIMEIDEWENIYELNSSLELLIDLDEYKLKAISFLFDEGITLDLEDAIIRAEDVIVHEDQTMEDVAFSLIHDCYNLDDIPSVITNHIDYEAIGNDLELDGNYTVINDDVYEYIG